MNDKHAIPETDTLKTVESTQTESETTPQTHKPAKKRRWVRGLLLGLLFLLVAPVVFLATNLGQKTTVELVQKFVDGLTVSRVEGSLQDGLTLYDGHFKMDGVDVLIGQADLHIGFACMLEKQACVENIALKDTTVVVDTAKLPPSTPKESEPLGDIRLPLGVAVKNIRVENLHVKVDEMDIALNRFQSGISGVEKHIQLSPTMLDGLTLSLPPVQAGSSAPNSAEVQKSETVDWASIKQQLAKPLLTKLDPIKLPLHFDIPEFKASNIVLEQKVIQQDGSTTPAPLVKVSSIDLQGKTDDNAIDLTRLAIQSDKGNVAGQGKLTLSDNYPLDWGLKADSPELKEFKLPASKLDAQLSGELFGTTHLAIQTDGAVNAQIQGSLQLAEPKTPLNLTVKSDRVIYPFIAEKGVDPLKLEKVDIALTGDLLNYQLDTKVNASGMNMPASRAQLKGQGELTHFEISELLLNALDGSANLNGKVDWTQGVEWQSALKLNGINTKSLLPEWAALLSGGLESQGYAGRGRDGNEWSVAVNNMDVQGVLQQKKLQLKGALTSDSQTLLNVPNTQLIYGENTISLNGVLGEKSDFHADIKAPNLQGLLPHLKAGLNGKVRLQGKLTEPSLDLDLVANDVAYNQFKLQNLTAKGKISSENMVQGALDIGLRQFSYGEVKVEQANLVASGSEASHSLKLTSKGDPVAANLELTGKFDRASETWLGQLSHINIHSPVGEWKNDKAVQVNYDNKQMNANISAHCWNNPSLHLCFPQAFNAGKEGKIPFEIKRFDLSMLQEYLDPNSQIAGIVTSKGDAAWFTNKAPVVNVELNSNAINFVQKLDYRRFPLSLTPVKIVANMADNQLKLKTDVKVENNGRLVSDVVISDLTNKRALSGTINLDHFNLRLVQPLLSSGENVDGDINARLKVGGTALAPLLHGNLNLTGLAAKSNMMPFDVVGGNLALNFTGASSTLRGNIQTPESNLALDGDANWQKLDAWYTRVGAKANRFRVDIPNIAKVDVSPDIEVKVTPKALILGGTVDIPWARIAVEELPESAVTVSGDEVIIKVSKQARRAKIGHQTVKVTKNLPQTGSGMAINADIAINIGNDVKLDAYGLKTGLNGQVKVRQGSKGLGLYGQVYLNNGTFASFGQDLVIRKGLISFTGLPSQPTLDIEAIRNPEAIEDANVTAGVRVTEIADAPEIKLFSTPSMSQDQILSYILTGRGLDNSGDSSSSNSIAAALISMNLSKGSKAVGSVGSAFGISDLNVTTAGIGDNTKVVVSGSLSPRFNVKYGVGIFAPLTELTLRYRLAPSLYLQGVSSVNQAIDLLYRFSF